MITSFLLLSLWFPPTFVVPLILSFLILSSFVTPHIHCSNLQPPISFPVPSSTPMSLPRTSVLVLPPSCTPSLWPSRSFSCRTTLQTLSSSSSTRSARCGWLPHPVLHPPPPSIPDVFDRKLHGLIAVFLWSKWTVMIVPWQWFVFSCYVFHLHSHDREIDLRKLNGNASVTDSLSLQFQLCVSRFSEIPKL